MLELNDLEIGKGKMLYRTGQLQLQPGELSILFGANGAGKSTLLDAIALGKLTKGSMLINGQSLAEQSPVQRAKQVALVESRFHGNDYLTVRDYLELGRHPHTDFLGRITEADALVISRVVAQLGIGHLLQQSTETLSDGERQRVSIARALIQETALILLDEPTSFLDYPNKRAILQLLKSIVQSQQKMVLLVSHDLELCLEYGDCFLLIDPAAKQLHYRRECTLEDVIAMAFPDRSF